MSVLHMEYLASEQNHGLALVKKFGICSIGVATGDPYISKYAGALGVENGVFGHGQLISNLSTPLNLKPPMRVYDEQFNVVFDGFFTDDRRDWDQALEAARTAWAHSPLGYIFVGGIPSSKVVSLLGFRELYRMAQDECGFPSLD